MLTPADS